MTVPSPRNKLLPARGEYATLEAAKQSLFEGEFVWAKDTNKYYQVVDGELAPVTVNPNELALVSGSIATVEAKADQNTSDIALNSQSIVDEAGLRSFNDIALQTQINAKADLIDGKIPTSQVPGIAISEFLGEVADEAAMLALVGEKGDWCIRTDVSDTYVITGDDPSVLSSWTELASPGGAVASVNNQTGAVVLGAADVGAATAAQGAIADSAIQPGDAISQLINDSGYITAADVPAAPDVPTKTSDLTNDSGFITAAEAPVQPGDLFSGSYNDLTDKPDNALNLAALPELP